MPDIHPFRGTLYNSEKIKDFTKVVTEPYDVISPAQRASYYKMHPYNIIRLILGKRKAQDSSKNNQYTRAQRTFADWQKRKVLVRDKKEGIYIYSQTFSHNNKRKTRTGFVVLLKLEDFAKNTILPHENTDSLAVQDRLKLLQACRANLSPIFALFSDPQGRINKLLSQYKRGQRSYIAIEKDKTIHRLWRMSSKTKITAIKKLLKDEQIFIADGHHRYEAALNYKMRMQKKLKRFKKRTLFNYVMTCLVATADPGLAILPTHRVLSFKAKFEPQQMLRDLRKNFQVRMFSTSEQLFSYMRENRASTPIFGVYFGKKRFCTLKLKDKRRVYKFMDKDRRRSPQRDLDVSILHSFIIERSLNLAPFEGNIYYTRDAQEAIKLVDKSKYHLAFFLKALKVRQVKRMAKAGEKMPHKSTYFYPKLLTGLVINKL